MTVRVSVHRTDGTTSLSTSATPVLGAGCGEVVCDSLEYSYGMVTAASLE